MEDSAYKVNRYGSYFEGNDYNPVERVTWYDAVYFCNRLSDRSKLERAYTMTDVVFDEGSYHIVSAKVTLDLTKNGYRLPTETEWEWAARGGDPSLEVWEYDFAGSQSIDSVGWYSGNASGTTHKVGTKSPNSLKIFDMTRNVWEWVYDGYENTSGREATNPIGNENATLRIEKGGRWGSSVGECEVDYRKTNPPSFYGFCLGFRIARSGNYE